MKRKDVKNILTYYRNIPGMIEFENKLYREIQDTYYNGLKSPNADGMPHSSSFGSQTETMGLLAVKDGAAEELQKHQVRIEVYKGDMGAIQGCLDTLNGVNKKIIYERYFYGYSWTKIAIGLHKPESTVRSWHDRALDRFGGVLEYDVPMLDELVLRASRAR